MFHRGLHRSGSWNFFLRGSVHALQHLSKVQTFLERYFLLESYYAQPFFLGRVPPECLEGGCKSGWLFWRKVVVSKPVLCRISLNPCSLFLGQVYPQGILERDRRQGLKVKDCHVVPDEMDGFPF